MVRLSLNSYIIWLDFTQSYFFSYFRYFGGENLKRCSFGRFWSEKGRKTTKTQKTLKCTDGDAVTSYNVTPSWAWIWRSLEDKAWRARTLASYIWWRRQRRPSKMFMSAWRRHIGRHRTLIAAMTPSEDGLTPSAHVVYIYPTNFYCFRGDFWWRTLGHNPNSCITDLGEYFYSS